MRDEPTTSEREFYQENGFLIVAEFLRPDELEEWRTKVDAAVMNRGDQRLSFATEDATNIASQNLEQGRAGVLQPCVYSTGQPLADG